MSHEVNKADQLEIALDPEIALARLAMLQRVRVVLVSTSLARNIGSAARAMRTMGLTRLYLVNPEQFPHEDANVLAAGADDVLQTVVVCQSLSQALADCTWSFGTSARDRRIAVPELSPRAACHTAVAQLRQAEQAEIALVFGSERVGLLNEELALCQARVQIPTDASFSSLNLSQAVQLLAYELRVALLGDEYALPARSANIISPSQLNEHIPAPIGEFEAMMQHLTAMLHQLQFHGTRNPELVLTRLRRLLQRAAPDHREIQILRGICSEVQYKLDHLPNSLSAGPKPSP